MIASVDCIGWMLPLFSRLENRGSKHHLYSQLVKACLLIRNLVRAAQLAPRRSLRHILCSMLPPVLGREELEGLANILRYMVRAHTSKEDLRGGTPLETVQVSELKLRLTLHDAVSEMSVTQQQGRHACHMKSCLSEPLAFVYGQTCKHMLS